MFWDKLPIELRVYILSIRHDMRANAQEMIAYVKKMHLNGCRLGEKKI